LSKRVLVTGATGQDGRYLLDLLRHDGCDVQAQTRKTAAAASDGVRWHCGELTDIQFLKYLIAELRPDEIYNFAALSRPHLSWEYPRETTDINADVPQTICELLVRHRPRCRLFQATSSEIFGDCSSEWQNEDTPCKPRSPYAISKLFAHHAIGAYRQQYGLHACSGILFNHESPYRPLAYVSQKIAYAAAAVSCGLRETRALDEQGRPILSEGILLLGDLTVRRDFGFAGDYVEAMCRILGHSEAKDYVVGTGETHSIQEFCEVAFASVNLDWRDHVRVDRSLIRKVDSHFTRADSSKIATEIGWRPRVTFKELVEMMVRAQISSLDSGAPQERDATATSG
jgi:GDPmannose 4,6-dehydratase